MKVNGAKRKVFDAVDLLTDAMPEQVGENGIVNIPVDLIQPFHNHPFRLYEGERLADMVESIREHGVLNPVIVQKLENGYEMLSGHNRLNAAKSAGIKEIPALVKENLTEDEAYVYVIETNMLQRSFADLLPSEKAAVMAAHYDKMCCRGKRNDIIQELEILSGISTTRTCGHNGHKPKNRDIVAEEYGFSSRNVARYLRLNYLIQPFKDRIDENKLGLVAAVDLSYLEEQEQQVIWEMMERQELKMKPKMAAELRKNTGTLTEQIVAEIMEALAVKKQGGNSGVSLMIPKTVCSKYFDGLDPEQMMSVVELALEAWFTAEGGEKHV